MKKSQQRIDTETIVALAKKDYECFQKKEKSYKLLNWFKDELILCQVYGKKTLIIEPKALARVINILGLIRGRNLNKCIIEIVDSTEALVNFDFDLSTLDNAERRRLNNEWKLGLEEVTEDEVDRTYDHMI